MNINFEKMATETRNPNTMNLDQMTPLEIVTVMNQEDALIPKAIEPHLNDIAQVVEWGVDSVSKGGRIFYAFIKAKEGAEDDRELGKQDLVDRGLTKDDLVIGLAASGRTPYVLGGLEYAKEVGCHTAAVTCNADSILGKTAEVGIDVVIGPEVLTGSTRLKAGTAQKMILNMFSTAIMVGCGKAYSNLMVDVQQTNEKLVARARRIVMQATGADEQLADEKIREAGGSCKTAITMILAGIDAEEAKKRLEAAGGHVRQAIS